MGKKILVLFISIFYFSLMVRSQDIVPIYRYNQKTKMNDTVFYSESHFPYENTFINQYVVIKEKTAKDTLYIVKLIFNKLTNTIEIVQCDMQSKKTISKKIKFENTTHPFLPYCVKNYRFNDTTLSMAEKEKNDTILFTVAEATGRIFLHQFLTIDNKYHFNEIVRFKNYFLEPHLKTAKLYWEKYYANQRAISEELAVKQEKDIKIKKIDSLKSAIRNDYIMILKQLKKKENDELNKPRQANDTLEIDLKKALDICFHNQFDKAQKDIKYWTISLTINSDNKGNIINIGLSLNFNEADNNYLWFNDIYNNNIKSIITSLKLIPVKNEITNKDYYPSLHEKYNAECHKLDYSMISFNELFDSIKKDLDPFIKKEFHFSTIYNYKFEYSSTIKQEQWRIIKDHQFLTFLEFNNIEENKKKSFLEKYPNPKRGKYKVYIYEAKSGGISLPEKVDSAKIQYKFMSHIGFNIGFNTDDIQGINPNNKFYNLYFTNHHLGLFGGYGEGKDKNHSYFEGGMYLSPCNFFYFKLGVAKLHEDTKPGFLFGVSLIFPVIQFEVGYNIELNSPYIAGGLNIPIYR